VILQISVLLLAQQCLSALNVTRINNGDLYTYTEGVYFGMFMVTPKGVIAIDAPPTVESSGQTIMETIRNYTNKEVKWVIYSHHHLDHVGSIGVFPKDAEYICHKKAADLIKDSGLPVCTKTFKDTYTLKVDDKHYIELSYHGTVHTEDNLYIYIPTYKLLMLADFVFPQWGPYHSLGMQASLVRYYEAFDVVLDFDFDYYVGGHVDRVGNKNDVKVGKQLIEDLVSSIKEGMSTLDYDAIVKSQGGANGTNSFTIFRAWTDAVSNYCVNNMLNVLGWSKKLIDPAAYMDTHCFLVYEYVNINY